MGNQQLSMNCCCSLLEKYGCISHLDRYILDHETIKYCYLKLELWQSMVTCLHTTLPFLYWLKCLYLVAQFQDILLRDQAKATAGTTKIQKEIIEQHISHRLRFSLRVGFISVHSILFPICIWLVIFVCQFTGVYFHPLS